MKSQPRYYKVTLTGEMPLLMHSDDIDWADKMEVWRSDKDNKKTSKAGDDRSPAHRWLGHLYQDDNKLIVVPTENIMRAMMEGAAGIPVPGGRGGKTFKAQSQSGIIPNSPSWPLLVNGKTISFRDLEHLVEEPDFHVHRETVEKLGFSLYVKRARIGQNKHIRVRPRFEGGWSVSGHILVTDEQITTEILNDILEFAGKYKGIGDWRPSSKTPGTFGCFKAAIENSIP